MPNKQTTAEDTDDRVIYLDDLPDTSYRANMPIEPLEADRQNSGADITTTS